MKVIDLDGKTQTLSLAGFSVDGSQTRPRSDLHVTARQIIKGKYPLYSILEEVGIQVRKGKNAFLDFFIPQPRVCIEVNGRQHFEFVQFFHNNLIGFKLQQKADREKREWLALNKIKLIEFNYNEEPSEWKNKL